MSSRDEPFQQQWQTLFQAQGSDGFKITQSAANGCFSLPLFLMEGQKRPTQDKGRLVKNHHGTQREKEAKAEFRGVAAGGQICRLGLSKVAQTRWRMFVWRRRGAHTCTLTCAREPVQSAFQPHTLVRQCETNICRREPDAGPLPSQRLVTHQLSVCRLNQRKKKGNVAVLMAPRCNLTSCRSEAQEASGGPGVFPKLPKSEPRYGSY